MSRCPASCEGSDAFDFGRKVSSPISLSTITIMPHLRDRSFAVSIIMVCFAIFEKIEYFEQFFKKMLVFSYVENLYIVLYQAILTQ